MIIIDSDIAGNINIKSLFRMIEKDLPNKVVVCGDSDIDSYLKKQLDDAGVNFINGRNQFSIMAGIHKVSRENGESRIKVFSENPMALSFLTNKETEVISPSNRRSHSASDVKRAMKVKPEKVIDFLYILGSKNAKTNQWLPADNDTVATWLEHSNIVKLVRDEHSPAKSHSMFESRLERGIEALKSRQRLFQEIKDFDVDFNNLKICHSIPQDLAISSETLRNDGGFSLERLSEIIDFCKSRNEPLSIFVKENKSPAFVAGLSDRIELLITDSKGKSVLINHELKDSLNKTALDIITKEIEEGLTVCTNNGKDLFKATCFRSGRPGPLTSSTDVHDVNVMAFSLDNRNKSLSLNRLHSIYNTNDISDQGLAVISLFNRLMYHFQKPGNEYNYNGYVEYEKPVIPVLAKMELQGVPVSKEKYNFFKNEVIKRKNAISKQMKEMAFDGFSPDNANDLKRMLFDVLKLPVIKRTPKNDISISAEVMKKLSEKHSFPGLYTEYSKLNKMLNSANGFLNYQNPYSKKIHCVFQQSASQNGRIQSKEPNIQGLPSKSPDANRLRRAFCADFDEVFISLDYKQFEVMILAALSGDSKLQNIVLSGEDIHRATAAQLFDCDIESVTEAQRTQAKAINFGIFYGKTKYGLSKDLDISKDEAQAIIYKYFETYPGVKNYLDFLKESASNYGYVLTKSCKKIYMDNDDKKLNLNSAMNAPMQGTAAEIMKKAMVKAYNKLIEENMDASMFLQIHDELVIKAKKDDAEKVERLVSEIMLNEAKESKLSVPLGVDCEVKTSLSQLDIIIGGNNGGGNISISKNLDSSQGMSLNTA